jgi:cell division septal protein FtsQ
MDFAKKSFYDDESTLCSDNEESSLLHRPKAPKSQSRQVLFLASVFSGLLVILGLGLWWYSSPDSPIGDVPLDPTNVAVIGKASEEC